MQKIAKTKEKQELITNPAILALLQSQTENLRLT